MNTKPTPPPIISRLNPSVIQAVSSAMREKSLAAGEVVFRQDDPGDTFYVVRSGKLALYQRQADGQETLAEVLGPGACTGETSLLISQPRHATLVAEQDSQVLCLSKAEFDRLAEDNPPLFSELTTALLPGFQETIATQAITRLFGALDQDTLQDLYDQLEWRRLDCGQVLCRQGEPGNEMYIVIQGRLRFSVEEAGSQRDLGEVGAGESIGEFALLTESGSPESTRSATVYATRLTDVIVIARTIFENLLCRSPQAVLKLAHQIIQRELSISKSSTPHASSQVIAVLPAQAGRNLAEFTHQLADTFNSMGSTLLLDPVRFEDRYGKPGAAHIPLDHPTGLLVNIWMDEHVRQHQFTIYDTGQALETSGHLSPWAQRCIENADVILLVGEGSARPDTAPLEKALVSAQTRARLELVLLHPAGCAAPSGTAAWLESHRSDDFPIAAHHQVRLGNPADFRRLCRRVGGRPVGLALSGGGARGYAHIGAIRALEEANIEVDWVGGASMGSIIAAGLALDWDAGRLRQLAAEFSDPKKLLDYTFPYASITATRRITALLQKICGDTRIEDTWRPYFCVSSNLTRGLEQLHTRGLLWKAVRASMAFPAVFAPVLEDGCVLIDGGAANNLPIDRLRELCPGGTVIGVDLVTGSPTNGEYNFGPSLSGWQALGARLNPFSKKVKAPSLIDIVAGIVYSNIRYRLNETWRCADLLIQIPVEAYGLLEFDQYDPIIELGYQATKEQLKAYQLP